MKEQLMREVTSVGNGAHIFAPKEWLGDEVILIRKPKQSLKERIYFVLEPYLGDIKGVYLFGSNARGEAVRSSDVDLFVISNKKIKADGFEIISLEEDKIAKAIKLEPVIMYSIFSESKSIINSDLMERLRKKYKPKLKDFKGFLEGTERIININKGFLELGDNSDAISYSIILRLRGIFIINQLLRGRKYSHKDFKLWVRRKVSSVDYDAVYDSYRSAKEESSVKNAKIGDLEKLLELLEKEMLKLCGRIYGKKKKAS